MRIPNTNIELKNGAYFISFTDNEGGYGKRTTVITYNPKKTVKKYKKAGYYVFGGSLAYFNEMFFGVTKGLKIMTRNKIEVVIGNAMYHINEAVKSESLDVDIYPAN